MAARDGATLLRERSRTVTAAARLQRPALPRLAKCLLYSMAYRPGPGRRRSPTLPARSPYQTAAPAQPHLDRDGYILTVELEASPLPRVQRSTTSRPLQPPQLRPSRVTCPWLA